MYERILAAVQAMPWMIEPTKGQMIADILSRRSAGVASDPQTIALAVEAKKPKPQSRGPSVALIPIYGVMTQRADFFTEMSGMASTEAIGRQIDEAMADPGIEAIVLDVDSPGGSVFGTAELADKVAAATKAKKVTAVANSEACSAAYYVASQASEFVVSPSSMVGSVGVYLMHIDRSEEMKQAGRTVTYVSAGERKTAANQYAPLDSMGRSEMEGVVNGYYDQFVKAVSRGRGVSQTKVKEGFGRGGVVLAEAAVKEGMADKIGTLESVLARYGVSLSDIAPSQQSAELNPRSKSNHEIEIRKRRLLLS